MLKWFWVQETELVFEIYKFKFVLLFMIDWFQWHVNPSWFILCLEIRESHSLYIHIYICVDVNQKVF